MLDVAALQKYAKTTFQSLPAAQVVEEIRQGKNFPTQAAVLLSGTASADIRYRAKLVDAGMVPCVLERLSHCPTREFHELLSETNGDLAFPSVWVNLLLNTTAKNNLPSVKQMDEVRIEVAKNLGPLVQCMAHETETREFFRNQLNWYNSIFFFICLVQNLVLTSATVPILRKYPNLQDLLIQSLFWETHRPDLVKQAKAYDRFVYPDMFAQIRTLAPEALQEFADVETKQKKTVNAGTYLSVTPAGMKTLKGMAMTKIVNPFYEGAKCDTTFHVGLVELLKQQQQQHESKSSSLSPGLMYTLQQFIIASLVDKHMITSMVEMVDMAISNSATERNDLSLESAQGLIGGILQNSLVHVQESSSSPSGDNKSGPTPDDDRFAVAIKAGLLETLLKYLIQFSSSRDSSTLVSLIGNLFKCASAVALLKKSSNAVQAKRDDIVEAVRLALNTYPEGKVKELIGVVQSIVDINVSGEEMKGRNVAFCRRCHKGLSSDKVKQCSRCKRANYCSKECQAHDWKHGGHKRDCKHMVASGIQAEKSGGGKQDIRRAQKHEENVSMAGNKVFSDNIGNIIVQACVRDYDLLESIVMIDLREAPPTTTLKLAKDFLSNDMHRSDPNFAHTRRIFERNKANGALTAACISLDTNSAGRGEGSQAVLLKTFPGFACPEGSWTAAQMNCRSMMGDYLTELRGDSPEELEENLRHMRLGGGFY